jgi:hypothetical protein
MIPIYKMQPNVEMRWFTAENLKGERAAGGTENFGRKGKPCVAVASGESHTLAEVSGRPGMVRRIWYAMDKRSPQAMRSYRIQMFWDGEDQPAVDCPVGDFFGTGLGLMPAYECAFFSNPEGRNHVCHIPMPFRSGMRIVFVNEHSEDITLFYEVDCTLGDAITDDTLYFHACWNRENPTTMREDYTILPRVEGAGRFLGTNIGVQADTDMYFKSWWGEGEAKIFIDGDSPLPTLCGTGTEDYIGTSWGQGRYTHLYQGCPVADHEKYRYCFYRYHVPDPIFFGKDIQVTMQQLGCYGPDTKPLMHYADRTYYKPGETSEPYDFSPEVTPAPYGLFEREDDWSSTAYFYLDRPVSGLAPLASRDVRIADLDEAGHKDERVDA